MTVVHSEGCILPLIVHPSNGSQLLADILKSSIGRAQGMWQSSFISGAGLSFPSELELVVTR